MKLAVIILNKLSVFQELLKQLADEDFFGATIIDSAGLVGSLSQLDDEGFLGSLKLVLNSGQSESKTILMVLEKERVKDLSVLINKVTGGLSKPNTGIMFTLDIDQVEGLSHNE